MKWVLFIIAVVVIFVLYKRKMTKIDADYEKAMKTPGRASYLRDNYPILVAYIESLSDYEVEFERADLIHYTNTSNRIKKQIVIQHFSDMICVVYVLENIVFISKFNWKAIEKIGYFRFTRSILLYFVLIITAIDILHIFDCSI